jgi:hypothetical protein
LLKSEHIGNDFACDLPGQRVIALRQEAAIQSALDFGNPGQMEGMERSRRDAAPIVRRRGST